MIDTSVRSSKQKASAPSTPPSSKAKPTKGSSHERSTPALGGNTKKSSTTKEKRPGEPKKAHALATIPAISSGGAIAPLFGPQAAAPQNSSTVGSAVDALSKGIGQIGNLFKQPTGEGDSKAQGLQASPTNQGTINENVAPSSNDQGNNRYHSSASSANGSGETIKLKNKKPTKQSHRPAYVRQIQLGESSDWQSEWNNAEFELIQKRELLKLVGRGSASRPIVNEMIDLYKRRIHVARAKLQSYVDQYNKDDLRKWPKPREVQVMLELVQATERQYKEFLSGRGMPADKSIGSSYGDFSKKLDVLIRKHIDEYAKAISARGNVRLTKYSPDVPPKVLVANLEKAMIEFSNHLNAGHPPSGRDVQEAYNKLANADYHVAAMYYLSQANAGVSPSKIQPAFNRYINLIRNSPFQGEVANYKKQERHDKGSRVVH